MWRSHTMWLMTLFASNARQGSTSIHASYPNCMPSSCKNYSRQGDDDFISKVRRSHTMWWHSLLAKQSSNSIHASCPNCSMPSSSSRPNYSRQGGDDIILGLSWLDGWLARAFVPPVFEWGLLLCQNKWLHSQHITLVYVMLIKGASELAFCYKAEKGILTPVEILYSRRMRCCWQEH